MAGLPPLTLTLASDLSLLPVVRNFVESVCRAAGLDQQNAEAIVLATNEAASNVIRHAHRGKLNIIFHVQCKLLEHGLEVCLLDEGEPFDVDAVPYLDPAELRCGGRGVFLMRALMDELSCTPREKGGNALRMVKWVDPSLSAAAEA